MKPAGLPPSAAASAEAPFTGALDLGALPPPHLLQPVQVRAEHRGEIISACKGCAKSTVTA